MRVALIFPGQGAQEVGMGREFYDQSPEAKTIFDQANQIVPNLIDIIFKGPAEKLTSTAFCQPAIFTFSVAALKAFQAHPKFKSIEPVFACGLSLGEYPALVACGAMDFTDALKLVVKRSLYMEEATKLQKGAMAAVIGFDQAQLIAICQETGAEVANFNAPDQIVITGDAQKVKLVSEKIQAAGAKRVIPLEVSGAFHSSLMKPAADKFQADVAKATINPPQFAILSNVDALPTQDPNLIRQNLTHQITSSVRWVDSVNAISAKGITMFFEIGPGTVLKGLIRKINRDLTVYNIQTPKHVEELNFPSS